MIRLRNLAAAFSLTAALFTLPASADTTNVAVAANFTEASKQIAAAFKAKTGHEAVLSFGSSGQFLTQITQGAPFQVFLSADAERPKKAVTDGFGVPGSVFTYAIGKLVLWSPKDGVVTGEATLRDSAFNKLSIANPAAAPYGAAAIETMKKLDLYTKLEPKIVQGNSIAQALQFVESGNAEVGFVALAQLAGKTGSRWMVPQELYSPILQDAVLIKAHADSVPAKAFLEFLKGPEASAIIEKYGYVLPARS